MTYRSHNYYVYITTNPKRTVLYTGVTKDLERRLNEHFENRGKPSTFAGQNYCYKLLYFEYFPMIDQAILREKEIKLMNRDAKLELIKSSNPKLLFLWPF